MRQRTKKKDYFKILNKNFVTWQSEKLLVILDNPKEGERISQRLQTEFFHINFYVSLKILNLTGKKKNRIKKK